MITHYILYERILLRKRAILLIAMISMISCQEKPVFIKEREISRLQILKHFSDSKSVYISIHSSINITDRDRGNYVEYKKFKLDNPRVKELAGIFDEYTSSNDPDGPVLRMASPKHSILFVNAENNEDFKIDIDFDDGLLQARDQHNQMVNFQYSSDLVKELRDFFNKNFYMH